MRAFLAFALLFGFAAVETVSGFVPGGATWQLTELDGAPWTARATLSFDASGRVSGQAACNRFTGNQSAPYPWLEIGPLASTRMACPELDAEATYLAALQEMTIVEVSGDVVILSNDDGRSMVFSRVAADG